MDHHQGPAAERGNSAQCHVGGLDGRGDWGKMDMCVCMSEFLCCPPESITTSLVGYIPI